MNAAARALNPADAVEQSNVVVLPTDESGEHALLAGLLGYSGGTVSAAALLNHFPSIGHALSAEPSQLRAFGLTGRDVALLRLVRETACHIARADVRSRPVLSNWHSLSAYLQTAMAHEQIEQFRVLYLDRKNHLIADEVQQRGTVDHTPVYPREVMKRALILNASALIVVHFVARNKMDLMCPAPLCGQAQHSRCFPRLFGARSHITGSGYSERRGGAETGRVIVVLTAARLTVGTRGAKSAFTTS